MVFRYVLCRCVIWRATPSCIEPEMTFFHYAYCPRHNTTGERFRDYGSYSLPCKDTYFERFGGYNMFWAFLDHRYPEIFELLNGSAAISESDLIQGRVTYMKNEKERPAWLEDVDDDYWFDFVDTYKSVWQTFPDVINAGYLRLQKKRVERRIKKVPRKEKLGDEIVKSLRKQFWKSFMGMELREILSGDWKGEPHWILRD
ncbi:hypothetical protein ACEQ8H_002413 [Pleosporales sp. CAS-2024a]